ncbi:MAG: hypothetical protein WCJ09_17455, partial [Planctomycetota bacterium]
TMAGAAKALATPAAAVFRKERRLRVLPVIGWFFRGGSLVKPLRLLNAKILRRTSVIAVSVQQEREKVRKPRLVGRGFL